MRMPSEEMMLGKPRRPWVVALLCFITFGVYFVYWYYKINQEIVEYDRRIESSPGVSAVAVTIGWLFLFIAGIISTFNTAARARRMFHDFDAPLDVSPGFATILYALGGLGFPMLALFYPIYIQSALNHFWDLQEMKAGGEIRPAA